MSKLYFSIAALAILCMSAGCTPEPTSSASNPGGESVKMSGAPPATVDTHAHPSEGPHHGALIELGDDEFHAEFVHDDKSVTIYILDSAAKKAVPIDATGLTINVMHDGKPEQFKVPASPDAGDPSGKSSRFTLADAELAAHLDDEAAAPKLSITIGGKAYKGEIHHDHDSHDDHNH